MTERDELPRVFVRDIEPDPGYEFRVIDPGDEVAIEPGTWAEYVPAEQGAVEALRQVRDLLTTADGSPRPGTSLAIGRIDLALRDAEGQPELPGEPYPTAAQAQGARDLGQAIHDFDREASGG